MGWEFRHGGRLYLYRNRRVHGRPVKEYLAADEASGFGFVMADNLSRIQKREAQVRDLVRIARSEFRQRVEGLVNDVVIANAELRVVSDGILISTGFHRHHRGEWRMKRELAALTKLVMQLKTDPAKVSPLVSYQAPADDPKAVELFGRARAGDATALTEVRRMICEKKWIDWLGDLGRQATRQLIVKAAGGDVVWESGLTAKVNLLHQELLGDSATVLEVLLVRRVLNGWIAVHALELELTVRPPTDARSREALDKSLSRAQRRYLEAIRELARVRRLEAPRLLTRVKVVANKSVVRTA